MKYSLPVILLLILTACEGAFDGVYNKPQEATLGEGQLYMNATSWEHWNYIDFDSLAAFKAAGDTAELHRHERTFYAIRIPQEQTEGTDSCGIYTYWYDVFGKGLSVNERREYYHTDAQREPDHWSIAIHRDNIRTNGAEAVRTPYTSMDQLPESSADFSGLPFEPDQWNENAVWVKQDRMLQGFVGNQGIRISQVLSQMLTVSLPPIPPAFSMDSHVYLVSFPNRKIAALQLVNYMNPEGTKCWLTINYRYPY